MQTLKVLYLQNACIVTNTCNSIYNPIAKQMKI